MSYNIMKTIYGVTVEIDFDYTPGSPARGFDPPEPAEVVINEIMAGGQDITEIVSESFMTRCEEECYEVGEDLRYSHCEE